MLYLAARGVEMKFSEKVIAVRGALYIIQKQLASEIGFSFSTVNLWEQGHHEPSFIAQKRFEDFCKKKEIAFIDDKIITQ
jgi:DNA-binding transcriptional regulator YiaG